MRINPLKWDDRPLHPHRRRSVMVGARMMRRQRSHGRDGENQCANGQSPLRHLDLHDCSGS